MAELPQMVNYLRMEQLINGTLLSIMKKTGNAKGVDYEQE